MRAGEDKQTIVLNLNLTPCKPLVLMLLKPRSIQSKHLFISFCCPVVSWWQGFGWSKTSSSLFCLCPGTHSSVLSGSGGSPCPLPTSRHGVKTRVIKRLQRNTTTMFLHCSPAVSSHLLTEFNILLWSGGHQYLAYLFHLFNIEIGNICYLSL